MAGEASAAACGSAAVRHVGEGMKKSDSHAGKALLRAAGTYSPHAFHVFSRLFMPFHAFSCLFSCFMPFPVIIGRALYY